MAGDLIAHQQARIAQLEAEVLAAPRLLAARPKNACEFRVEIDGVPFCEAGKCSIEQLRTSNHGDTGI